MLRKDEEEEEDPCINVKTCVFTRAQRIIILNEGEA